MFTYQADFVYSLTAKSSADGANSAPSADPSDSSFGILKFNRSKSITKILFELKCGVGSSKFNAIRVAYRNRDAQSS